MHCWCAGVHKFWSIAFGADAIGSYARIHRILFFSFLPRDEWILSTILEGSNWTEHGSSKLSLGALGNRAFLRISENTESTDWE